VLVEGEQEPEAPWAYRKISLRILARGSGLDQERLARAAHLSVERYCSVLATVRGVSEVGYQVQVLDEADQVLGEADVAAPTSLAS
jgi:putative redox protein